MKLSFSSNAFVNFSVLEAVDSISAIGYQGIELLADIPHLNPTNLTKTTLSNLKKNIELRNLVVANINANTAVSYYGKRFWEPLFEPSLANPDEEAREWRLDYTRQCIDMAAYLDADSVSITSGRPLPGIDLHVSLEIFCNSLKELVPIAEQNGIRLGIEYEPGLLVENSSELLEILNVIDSPFLGVNLDLGHCQVIGENIHETITGFGGKIIHIHLEDIKGQKHYHLIPGQGDMDFKAIFHSLGMIDYQGFVTVELYTYPNAPEDAAIKAFDYLKEIVHWQ